MQSDGNFVAYSPQEVPYWATNTPGHPGAWIVLQDDGNLVVYDGANNPLWASKTVQDLNSPTFGYTDADGYSYVETSESWKQQCSVLPCFDALQWPDYSSTHVEADIDGQAVVIQLWKGWCEKFLGLQNFPGGSAPRLGCIAGCPDAPDRLFPSFHRHSRPCMQRPSGP